MSNPLALTAWSACRSALLLERWDLGELSTGEANDLASHVEACAACRDSLAALREARSAPLPPLRVVGAPARSGPSLTLVEGGASSPPAATAPPVARRSHFAARTAAGALALAAAAGWLLVARPANEERTKGAPEALGIYVQHGAEVRRAGPDEVVAPGDGLRFSFSLPRPAWVAVLSLDGAGRASVYFPLAGRAERIEAGHDLALPLATRLDATLGPEQIAALACDTPIELEPLRLSLEAGAEVRQEGCRVLRWRLLKR